MSTSSESNQSSNQDQHGSHVEVCPFCGADRAGDDRFCARCGQQYSARLRRELAEHLGPWCVIDARGLVGTMISLNSIRMMIRAGQVTRQTVLRGPTTRQFWRRAENVRAVSREFGICHSCGAQVAVDAYSCPMCHASQEPPADPWSVLDDPHGEPSIATTHGLPLVDLQSKGESNGEKTSATGPAIMTASDLTDACRLDLAKQGNAMPNHRRRRRWAIVATMALIAGGACGLWLRPGVLEGAQLWVQEHISNLGK